MDYLEVHGVLRAVGAERLPPGWKDFGPASKRRTLQKVVGGLSADRVAELAHDFVELPDDGGNRASDPSSEQSVAAWRPPYDAPASPAERYGLSKKSATAGSPGHLSSPAHVSAVNRAEPIFVVHGRDTAAESQTLLLVERTTGRSAVVLHEQVAGGRTVIEQIERHAAGAGYAIILLTGDDEGGLRGGELKPRARQNVILELGYFWGHLGRDRVAVLVEEGVELPSDAGGIHYITIDSGGGWKAKLLRELANAGFEVEWDKLRP
jgi:predicted nucleotide-binding protein